MPPPRRTSRRLYFILYQMSAEHAYSIAGYVPAEGEVIHVPPSPENEARLLFLASYPVGYVTAFDSDGPLRIHKPTGRHFATPDHLQQYARHYDEQVHEHRGLGLYALCPPELSPLRPQTADPMREQVLIPLSRDTPKRPHRRKYTKESYRDEIATAYWNYVLETGEEPDLLRDVLGNLSISISLSTHYRYVKFWQLPYPPPKR